MGSKRGSSDGAKKRHSRHSEKRTSAIFRSISNPNRIDILRVLYSKGSTSYTDLKDYAGFGPIKESGKFAYHLRDLKSLALIEQNKSERRYTITNQGKLILDLADKIAENVFMESGKLQVRSSDSSIGEFNKQRIIQSLVKEGDMPYELAVKITKDAENKIHKYDISYITSALIRELVNTVLLETGHEEYRSKLARFGMPAYDIRQMLHNLDSAGGGMEDLLIRAGQHVFTESVMFGSVLKDVADLHMKGSINMSNIGTWATLPDVLFVNIRDVLEGGMDIGGKHPGTSRIAKARQLSDVTAALSVMIQLLSREVSEEVVMAGLQQLLARKCAEDKDADIEDGVLLSFVTSSPSHMHSMDGDCKVASIRLNLGSDDRIVDCVINAYARYVKITPKPNIALVINYEKGDISSVSARASEIVLLGGKILFTKLPHVSSRGIVAGNFKADGRMSMVLKSMSVNLPSLAHEVGEPDAEYFMARLVLMLKPAIEAMIARKKEVFDAICRGLNPQIARSTQGMQRGHASLAINLVGLKEAVFDIMGFEYNRKGREVVQQIIGHAVDAGARYAKGAGVPVTICMTDSGAAERLARIDGRRYGKQITGSGDIRPYSQGMAFEASELPKYTNKSPPITLCNKIGRTLNAGLQVDLRIAKDETDPGAVKHAIEAMSGLVPSFMPVRKVAVCSECGFKEKPFETKCPKCHAPRRAA